MMDVVRPWILAQGFSAEDIGPFVLVIGLVLVSAALLMGIRKKRKRQGDRPSGREQFERSRQQSAMRGDLEQTMGELEQLAKRLSSQLDAKTLTIERRLAEADERIAELKRLGESTNGSAPSQKETAAISPAPASHPQQRSQTNDPPDELTRSIYQLADDGLGPSAIAHRVEEHVGKVELILALRNA